MLQRGLALWRNSTRELLGSGLLPPAELLHAAQFLPDPPWRWCMRCGTGVQSGAAACCDRCARRGVDRALRVVRLGAHQGALRDCILQIKHGQWEPMAELLGTLLGWQLVRCGVLQSGSQEIALVPAPMPWVRRQSRGIDHAQAIAGAAARAAGVPLLRLLTQRSVGTQVTVGSRSQRLARVGRFRESRTARLHAMRGRIQERRLVIIDDVRTTGATLDELASALRQMGARPIAAGVLAVRE